MLKKGFATMATTPLVTIFMMLNNRYSMKQKQSTILILFQTN